MADVQSDEAEEAERSAYLKCVWFRCVTSRDHLNYYRVIKTVVIYVCRRIVNAFRCYPDESLNEIGRWEYNYKLLPQQHRELLPELPERYADARRAVQANAEFIAAMLSVYESPNAPPHLRIHPATKPLPPCSPADAEKVPSHPGRPSGVALGAPLKPLSGPQVRYVFKNLFRDWGEEGALEREQCYSPMLAELRRAVPPPPRAPSGSEVQPSVLVPGAGLGRLCVEVAAGGYPVQGNEFSYYMLLASSFMLNCMHAPRAAPIFPWALNTCNSRSFSDQARLAPMNPPGRYPAHGRSGALNDAPSCAEQLQEVRVPDRAPPEFSLPEGYMSMCAGDFVEVYSQPDFEGAFDAVLTCFFIDTAHNVLQYLDILWSVLRPGGVWINHGPLLWHWADAHTYLATQEMSIELPLDVLLRCAAQRGFVLETEQARCVIIFPALGRHRSTLWRA